MHKLAELCVKRPVFATMLIVSLTVMGAYSFFGLGVDYFPNIDIPTVAVTVTNPGASAEQIESEIIKKLEGELIAMTKDPEFTEKIVHHGLVPVGTTADAFGERIAREVPMWKEVAQKAKIKLE